MRSIKDVIQNLLSIPEERSTPERYRIIGRDTAILMLATTLAPLALMTEINYYEYKTALRNEIQSPNMSIETKSGLNAVIINFGDREKGIRTRTCVLSPQINSTFSRQGEMFSAL